MTGIDSRMIAGEDPYRVEVTYRYEFEDGVSREFAVSADLLSGAITHYTADRPAWTELALQKCPGCPLPDGPAAECPAAVSIADVIEGVSRYISHSRVHCTVTMAGKSVIAERSLQDALYPLIGLRMAVSGCPFLARFKPMARFHEPFATPLSTFYRSISMYLLSRYFRNRARAGSADWSLGGFRLFYAAIGVINENMAERLRKAATADAGPNGLNVLAIFGISAGSFFEEYLEALARLFRETVPEGAPVRE
jgi:hypothetical protein